MKTKKIFKYLPVIILMMYACSEKDLEVQSSRPLATNYYKTDDQCLNGVAAAYNPMTNSGDVLGWGASLVIWGSVASEDAYAGGGGPGDQVGYQSCDLYTNTPADAGIDLTHFWINYFMGINRANLLINNITPDDDVKKSAVAQGQFLCAFYYFYTSRLFGGLPLMKKVPTPNDKIARSTLDQTYTFIEDLLVAAIGSGALPERTGVVDPSTGVDDPSTGFATKASAQALLGKVYMYHAALDKKYYTSAIEPLLAVTQSRYKLETDFWHIFSPSNRHGVESIFEIDFTNRGGSFGNADARLCGIRTIATQVINDTIDYGWGFNQPTQNLVDFFNANNDKIRLNATVFYADTVRKWHAKYRSDSLQYQFLVDGYWDRKHYVDLTKETVGIWRSGSNPQIVLRLADIYLLLAEAYFQTGDVSSATTYVNKVRERVHLADIAAVTLKNIKDERRLELALEGDHYFDLVRWGDAATVLGDLGYTTGTPGVKTNGLFPIPLQEINRTQGTIKQNDGY